MLLYKKIDIPNLASIQQEVLAVVDSLIINVDPDKIDTARFMPVNLDELKKNCPTLVDWLKSQNLLDRWYRSALVRIQPHSELEPHVDSPGWAHRMWALNIPLIDCDHSYTVFYHVEPEVYNSKISNFAHNGFVQKIDFDHSEATEVDRVKIDSPYFCRVGFPHSALNEGDRVRKLLSLRFDPEIFDVIGP